MPETKNFGEISKKLDEVLEQSNISFKNIAQQNQQVLEKQTGQINDQKILINDLKLEIDKIKEKIKEIEVKKWWNIASNFIQIIIGILLILVIINFINLLIKASKDPVPIQTQTQTQIQIQTQTQSSINY